MVGGVALVMIAALPTAARLVVDRLDGPGWYAAISAALLGAASLTWTGKPPTMPAPGITRADVVEALWIVAAGLAVFGLGARLTGGARSRPALPRDAGQHPPIGLLAALFALSLGGLTAGLASGAIGVEEAARASSDPHAFAQGFLQLSLLGGLIVLISALWVLRRDDRRWRSILLALVALQAAAGFATGYKQYAALPVLYLGVAYVACRARIPWRGLSIAAVTAITVLLPATIIYRGHVAPNPNPGARDVTTFGGMIDEAEFYLSVRFRLIDNVALIHARTPDLYPYASGRRYTLLPALMTVPRAIWSDKPALASGLEFSHTYWEIAPNVATSTPLTQPGDLLRNFGLVGVLIGMALWGLIVGGFTRACTSRRSPRTEAVYLVGLVLVIAYVELDLPQLIAGGSRTVVVAALVSWLCLPGRGSPPGYLRIRRRLTNYRSEPGIGAIPVSAGH